MSEKWGNKGNTATRATLVAVVAHFYGATATTGGHMTDTDVLVKWGDIISVAESGSKAIDYYAPSPLADCIADLAVEVRALRAERDALRERLAAQEPDATLGRLVREGREAL